jgi:hypothetical protein
LFPELHQAEDRIKSWFRALYMIRLRHKKRGRIWLFGTQHGTARKNASSVSQQDLDVASLVPPFLGIYRGECTDALFHLVDAHAAVLIHRLLDITRVEMMPTELLYWAMPIFKSPMWQEISKGKDTMGWDGIESLRDKMTISDTDGTAKRDANGKGRAE